MANIAKVEGNKVVIYKVPGNQRGRAISGWPDSEKVTSAIATEGVVTVSFNSGKVRVYDPENGSLQGTF